LRALHPATLGNLDIGTYFAQPVAALRQKLTIEY
jgi:hypothetical protein